MTQFNSSEDLEQVLAYHQASKHHFHAYARGPGFLDWETQPDPFRRYRGARLIKLEKPAANQDPTYEAAIISGRIPSAPLDHRTMSQLLYDSLAISAWKSAGGVSWALRVNPSSGNLHPTEGYLICGPMDGLCDTPMICHYAPFEHALEVRAQFSREAWGALVDGLPDGTVLIGLTSIHWREAWKYGERAFRYCQHDVGHAIGAVSFAAAGLGWQAEVLDDLGSEQLAVLLGVFDSEGPEAEHPDCLLAVFTQGHACRARPLPEDILKTFAGLQWQGHPNQLSPSHVDWPIIDKITNATAKPPTTTAYGSQQVKDRTFSYPHSTTVELRHIIRHRRSAVAMDGYSEISRNELYWIMIQTMPDSRRFPFNALPWPPRFNLALFVHRIRNLEPGTYVLVRSPADKEGLQLAMKADFAWQKPPDCPPDLGLYCLMTGDVRVPARQISCHQSIASDGCFSLGMIADVESSLKRFGAWFYRRLFWESGLIGQSLYLAAEAIGLAGTGIGCYFDDPMHTFLGLDPYSLRYQSLYHFTIGKPVEDGRLTTSPAYPDD